MHNFGNEMRKADRQNVIVEIIRERRIATQAELRDALRARGVDCDQGTLSRDVREMGLVKAAAEDGDYYYALIDDVSPMVRTSRLFVLKQMIRTVTASGNILVVKCGPGNGSAVGEALDHLNFQDIIGTVAGDDTLLAVVREGVSGRKAAQKLMKEIGLS